MSAPLVELKSMREAERSIENAARPQDLGIFISLCVGVGALVGIVARPDAWFDTLQKPALFPPQGILALLWLIYFFSMAFVGARVWRRTFPIRRWQRSIVFWALQIVCAWGWPLAIYRTHNLGAAVLLSAVGTLCAIIVTYRMRSRDPAVLPVTLLQTIWLFVLTALTIDMAASNFGVMVNQSR